MNTTIDIDALKKDFCEAYDQWSSSQVEIDFIKATQTDIVNDLHEKYKHISKSDIAWIFKAKINNDKDEQETKFEDKKDLYESVFL